MSARPLPPFRSWAEMLANPSPPPRPIWHGVLNAHDVLAIDGPHSCGKSMLALQLACAVSRGGWCLGWKCEKGRALVLHSDPIELVYSRLCTLAEPTGMEREEDVATMGFEGQRVRPFSAIVGDLLAMPDVRPFDLVAVDLAYEFNANNWMDMHQATMSLADAWHAAIVVVGSRLPVELGSIRFELQKEEDAKRAWTLEIDGGHLFMNRPLPVEFEYPCWRRRSVEVCP